MNNSFSKRKRNYITEQEEAKKNKAFIQENFLEFFADRFEKCEENIKELNQTLYTSGEFSQNDNKKASVTYRCLSAFIWGINTGRFPVEKTQLENLKILFSLKKDLVEDMFPEVAAFDGHTKKGVEHFLKEIDNDLGIKLSKDNPFDPENQTIKDPEVLDIISEETSVCGYPHKYDQIKADNLIICEHKSLDKADIFELINDRSKTLIDGDLILEEISENITFAYMVGEEGVVEIEKGFLLISEDKKLEEPSIANDIHTMFCECEFLDAHEIKKGCQNTRHTLSGGY